MQILGIELTNEQFDFFVCEQAKGKELKIVDGKVVAVERAMTEEEMKKNRIAELKTALSKYDYIGIKIATGRATKEDYAEQIEQMNVWAKELEELGGGANGYL